MQRIRPVRTLNIVDDFTPECVVAIEVDRSLPAVLSRRGYTYKSWPRLIVPILTFGIAHEQERELAKHASGRSIVLLGIDLGAEQHFGLIGRRARPPPLCRRRSWRNPKRNGRGESTAASVVTVIA